MQPNVIANRVGGSCNNFENNYSYAKEHLYGKYKFHLVQKPLEREECFHGIHFVGDFNENNRALATIFTYARGDLQSFRDENIDLGEFPSVQLFYGR
jgi:hypothetical protein